MLEFYCFHRQIEENGYWSQKPTFVKKNTIVQKQDHPRYLLHFNHLHLHSNRVIRPRLHYHDLPLKLNLLSHFQWHQSQYWSILRNDTPSCTQTNFNISPRYFLSNRTYSLHRVLIKILLIYLFFAPYPFPSISFSDLNTYNKTSGFGIYSVTFPWLLQHHGCSKGTVLCPLLLSVMYSIPRPIFFSMKQKLFTLCVCRWVCGWGRVCVCVYRELNAIKILDNI